MSEKPCGAYFFAFFEKFVAPILTSGGPASFVMPLQIGKTPIVVPRQHQFDEHVNDHQVDFSRNVAQRMGTIILVEDIEIGVKLGVSVSTLAIQILIGGFFFCIATIAYLRISNDELWRLGINSISKRKKNSLR